MVAEIEPNNTPAQAQSLNLGFDNGEVTTIRVDGNLTSSPTPTIRTISGSENNNSIGLADQTGILAGETDAIRTTVGFNAVGGNPDVDFFRISSLTGQQLNITADGINGFDTFIEVFNSDGELVAFDDDDGPGLSSDLDFTVPADGDYFVAVRRFGVDINNPFDPNDNTGNTTNGSAILTISQIAPEIDYYEVELNGGDILGAALDGAAQNIQIFNPDGVLVYGSDFNISNFDSSESQLIGNGFDNVVGGLVAPETGTYLVAVTGGVGSYDLDLNVNRPALESQAVGNVQYVYLDFDGATIDSSIFGSTSGIVSLSALSTFLPNWGLSNSDENAVIDSIIATVQRQLIDDVSGLGNNDDFEIVLLNSRDHPDPDVLNLPNISRIVVGGTTAELGITTLGIAQHIDVGNFDTDDTAITLLDLYSAATGGDSINTLSLAPGTSIIDAIGQIVGTTTAHEAGHILGNFHTENENEIFNIQDQGGTGIQPFAGADGIFGTADDPFERFGLDMFESSEGIAQGTQDTLNNIAFGASSGQSTGFGYRFDLQSLFYTGDDANDTVDININSGVTVDFNAAANSNEFNIGLNTAITNVETVFMNLGGGDNTVNINSITSANVNVMSGNGTDFISLSSGNDTINSGGGNDTLNGGLGADTLNGGSGVDTVDYSDSTSGVTVFTSGRSSRGGEAQGDRLTDIENITGSDQQDQIVLNASSSVDNTVNGGDGDDRIRERDGGTNNLNGEDGDDNIFGGADRDIINGGNDSDNLFGGGGRDTLDGGTDLVRDALFGGSGDDILIGRGGNDALRGNTGDDMLFGGTGNDNLQGGNQNDELFGGNGVDVLDGGSGNDILNGGTGNDRLTGGGSNDIFIFENGSGIDRITDFNFGSGDQIDLSDFGLADFDAVMALATQTGDDVRIQLDGDDRLILQDTTLASLDENDFILV